MKEMERKGRKGKGNEGKRKKEQGEERKGKEGKRKERKGKEWSLTYLAFSESCWIAASKKNDQRISIISLLLHSYFTLTHFLVEDGNFLKAKKMTPEEFEERKKRMIQGVSSAMVFWPHEHCLDFYP